MEIPYFLYTLFIKSQHKLDIESFKHDYSDFSIKSDCTIVCTVSSFIHLSSKLIFTREKLIINIFNIQQIVVNQCSINYNIKVIVKFTLAHKFTNSILSF